MQGGDSYPPLLSSPIILNLATWSEGLPASLRDWVVRFLQ